MTWRILFIFAFAGALFAQNRDADFRQLADRFFDQVYYRYDPIQGTSDGFHQYDTQLPSYSRAEIQGEIAALKKFEAEVEAFSPKGLSTDTAIDRELVLSRIRSKLLNLQSVRDWEKNPDIYSSNLTYGIFVIMSRNFAPPADRLKSLIAREKLIPRLLSSARQNLSNPPQIYTQVAIEQLPGIVSFFQKDVPSAFRAVNDRQLMAEFHQTNQASIAALTSYQTYLQKEVLPRSHGDFRLGADTFSKKLQYDEMVDTPLDRLLAIGFEDLRRNQAAVRQVAKQIDPKRTPSQIVAGLEKDFPPPNQLLQRFRDVLGGLRAYINEHHIVSIPPAAPPPIVQETPPFARALTFASMDTPGAYEKVAKEAFFNVTLPDPGWPKTRTDSYMEMFNRGTIVSTAVHEVYPGHYVQFLWMPKVPSKVRKLLWVSSNVEGWAHYCEQMMLDEGYGNHDPKLRIGQIEDALLRDARYIVGIEMHTGKMTFDQGVDFFVKEGYQSHETALKETKRGTSDPTYLYYTLGKLEILKLREDYKKLKGSQYSLEEFHNAFLAQGGPPVKLVRRALLGNDSPAL
ncbi:MAG TPA: DUF885 domain-containing protein [Bryobacteraceae bacterium]|nr:DUF885 domain-containing protein [Bryobacteraceae bacterium]